MVVDTIDVFDETFQNRWWWRYSVVNQEWSAKIDPKLLKHLCAEVILGPLTNIVSTERCFHCVDSRMLLQLVKQGHPSCRFLRFLITKAWMVVDEERVQVWKYKREYTGVLWWRGYVASIHENVLAPTVTVEVTKDWKLPLFGEGMYHLLCVVDRRVQHFGGSLPPSIQVTTSQRAPVISIDNAVGVQHRNNLKHIILPQKLCLWGSCVTQEVQSSSHHPRTDRLTRMYPSCYNDALTLGHILLILLACDGQNIKLVSSKCLT